MLRLRFTGSRLSVARRDTSSFEPHLINNQSGLGVQVVAVDINGDGTPEVLSAARKGAFVFFNKPDR